MTDGRILEYSRKVFTKEDFLKMIEQNFPGDVTMGNIAVITTVKSDEGDFQSVTFGKTLET